MARGVHWSPSAPWVRSRQFKKLINLSPLRIQNTMANLPVGLLSWVDWVLFDIHIKFQFALSKTNKKAYVYPQANVKKWLCAHRNLGGHCMFYSFRCCQDRTPCMTQSHWRVAQKKDKCECLIHMCYIVFLWEWMYCDYCWLEECFWHFDPLKSSAPEHPKFVQNTQSLTTTVVK